MSGLPKFSQCPAGSFFSFCTRYTQEHGKSKNESIVKVAKSRIGALPRVAMLFVLYVVFGKVSNIKRSSGHGETAKTFKLFRRSKLSY